MAGVFEEWSVVCSKGTTAENERVNSSRLCQMESIAKGHVSHKNLYRELHEVEQSEGSMLIDLKALITKRYLNGPFEVEPVAYCP